MNKKAALIILDGWGIGEANKQNAIHSARTPYMDYLIANYPNAQLLTHGNNVGLPEGQMGNSEVGHMNIGAGRVVWQMLEKINKGLQDATFGKKESVKKLIADAKRTGRLHLMGLVSDGGVHSHINHLIKICQMAENAGIPNIFIHAFLDGRDTDPKAGAKYIGRVQDSINPKISKIVSVIGRYFAMDRDHRWERTKRAYDLLTRGEGEVTTQFVESIEKQYALKHTDEFMEPLFCGNTDACIKEGDTVLCFNFRTDRGRQITEALTQRDLKEDGMQKLKLNYYTTTIYDDNFNIAGSLYTKDFISNSLGEVIANAGLAQMRAAETEKYPHVTFFFNGGKEEPFENEGRIMVNSPKVATYNLQPEMSALELTKKAKEYINDKEPEFICLNYANPDMVGHTGVFSAIVKAVETVDQCLKDLSSYLVEKGYDMVVIADHGNADYALNEDGTPNTAHSTNPVPIILLNKSLAIQNGILADVAPTLLQLLGVEQPKEMTGNSLIT